MNGLTKEDVTKKVLKNELIVKSNVSKRKSTSGVWSRFGKICDKDGKDVGFVACLTCNIVYSFDKNNGTSAMSRHNCKGRQPEP